MNRRAFFNFDIPDNQQSAGDITDSLSIMNQVGNYSDAPCGSEPGGPSVDASPAQTRSSNSLIRPTHIRASERLASRRTKTRSTSSRSQSDKLETPGLSTGSSETPETHLSQRTVTPEDLPNKKTRQRKQQANADLNSNANTANRKKFLERNRAAATKCREKKKEWVADLEETRFDLESQHNDLKKEYSHLKNEISLIKSQLMDHANCSDPNIDRWIENEAKSFVLGASDRYNQMLTDLGFTPKPLDRHDSISSTAGSSAMHEAGLVSPVTPSQSFHPGAFMPSSPIFYRPGLMSNFPGMAEPVPCEGSYPISALQNSTAEDATGFGETPMSNESLQIPTVWEG
ncbi:uncharacterized protein F4812DRAFT_77098 [Daldinia caldariorum]|uniref:uncharacterized protein n=1 Tax=Daldinia caldariorum TaxID=326644 RepID=UPI002007AEAA|nr:uncharacterized protein F4812DRAFT_77098 [Daldinia caldariorum]KAI1466381.1 hypothetical protein F4812DRAFT_77098 [Daldinia caldariorum]